MNEAALDLIFDFSVNIDPEMIKLDEKVLSKGVNPLVSSG